MSVVMRRLWTRFLVPSNIGKVFFCSDTVKIIWQMAIAQKF
jgi:hypothetical protein